MDDLTSLLSTAADRVSQETADFNTDFAAGIVKESGGELSGFTTETGTDENGAMYSRTSFQRARRNLNLADGMNSEAEAAAVRASLETGMPVSATRAWDNQKKKEPDLESVAPATLRFLGDDLTNAAVAKDDVEKVDEVVQTANYASMSLPDRRKAMLEQIKAEGYTSAQLADLKRQGYTEVDAKNGKFTRDFGGTPATFNWPMSESWYTNPEEAESLDKDRKSYDDLVASQFDEVRGSAWFINATPDTQAKYIQTLDKEIMVMRGLWSIYGGQWQDFTDEELAEAISQTGAALQIDDVSDVSVNRLRPAGVGLSTTDWADLVNFFGVQDLYERFTGLSKEELDAVHRNPLAYPLMDRMDLVDELESQAKELRGRTGWNAGAEMVITSLRFATELAAAGGGTIESVGTILKEQGLKGVPAALGKLFTGMAKLIPGRTMQAVETAIEETGPQITQIVENGQVLPGFDEAETDRMAEAYFNAVLSNYIEDVSEGMGAFLPVGKAMDTALKLVPKRIRNAAFVAAMKTAVDRLAKTKGAQWAKKFTTAAGFGGLIEEDFEEIMGDAIRYGTTQLSEFIGTNYGNLGQDKVFQGWDAEGERLLQLAATGLILQGVPRAIAAPGDIYRARQFRTAQRAVKERVDATVTAGRSPEVMEMLIRGYTGLTDVAYLTPKAAGVLYQSMPETMEAVGVTKDAIGAAETAERLLPVSMARIHTHATAEEVNTMLESLIPDPKNLLTPSEADKIIPADITKEQMDKATKAYNEKLAAVEEVVKQLEAAGRPKSEIKAFARLLQVADYFAAHNTDGMTAAEWIRNVGYTAVNEKDWLEKLTKGADSLYQGVIGIPGFYSNMMQSLADAPQAKMTPAQWLAYLQKSGGLKAGETTWRGSVEKFFEGRDPNVAVDKQEIIDAFENGMVDILEMSSENPAADFGGDANFLYESSEISRMGRRLLQERNQLLAEYDGKPIPADAGITALDDALAGIRELRNLLWHTPYGFVQNGLLTSEQASANIRAMYEYLERDSNLQNFIDEYVKRAELGRKWSHGEITGIEFNKGRQAAEAHFDTLNKLLRTNWTPDSRRGPIRRIEENGIREEYTTDGLDNKREIVIYAPEVAPYEADDNIHFGTDTNGTALVWVRFGETRDEDGKHVLVVDEIQSNRHQAGRERGYSEKNNSGLIQPRLVSLRNIYEGEPEFNEEGEEFTNAVFELVIHSTSDNYTHVKVDDRGYILSSDDGEYDDKELSELIGEDAAETVMNELIWTEAVGASVDFEDSSVPPAPFEKNWHELGMKRMIRYAAEHGYDKIAWTSGEQQAKRYNIGRVIDEIEVRDRKYDGTVMRAKGNRDFDFGVSEDGKITWSAIPEMKDKTVYEVFGKELGERIVRLAAGEWEAEKKRLYIDNFRLIDRNEDFDPGRPFSVAARLEVNGEEEFQIGVDWDGNIRSYKNPSSMWDYRLVGKTVYEAFGQEAGEALMDLARNGAERETRVLENEGHMLFEDKRERIKLGKDVVFGGEGMKTFYDKILKQFTEKYIKKWGAKVGVVTLPDVEEDGREMWGFDVTDRMKADVMGRGQPLFQSAPNINAVTNQLNVLKDASPMTKEVAVADNGMADSEEVTDEKTLSWLNSLSEDAKDEDKRLVRSTRWMQLIDGELYPVMNEKVAASKSAARVPPTRLGVWTKAAEHPEKAFWTDSNEATDAKRNRHYWKRGIPLEKQNPKGHTWWFELSKTTVDKDGKEGVSSVAAKYAPFNHSSEEDFINDQFTIAYKRPNVVLVEGVFPLYELNHPSGDSLGMSDKKTGRHPWNHKKTLAQLGPHNVTLTKYFKAERILSPKEAAEKMAGMFKDHPDVTVTWNVVPTPILKELLNTKIPGTDKYVQFMEATGLSKAEVQRLADTGYLDELRRRGTPLWKSKDGTDVLYEDNTGLKDQTGNRGAITFNEDWKATIALFEGAADGSTVIHETGHYIFDMMQHFVEAGLADDRMKSDYEKLRAWATISPEQAAKGYEAYLKGVPEGELPLTMEQWKEIEEQERLARGFEAYCMEGRAPSVELQGAFATLRRILLHIYKTVRALGVTLSDDVRKVFDGMLATETTLVRDSILLEAADQIDRELLGLSQAEVKTFRELIQKSNEQAVEAMTAEKNAKLKELRKQWRKEAQELMDGDPVYNVWFAVQKEGRMDYVALEEIAGEYIAQRLRSMGLATNPGRKSKEKLDKDGNVVRPAGYYSAKSGKHPATMAAQAGFDSVEEMIDALLASKSPQDFTAEYMADEERKFNAEFEMSETAQSVQASIEALEKLSEMLAVKGGQIGYRFRRALLKRQAMDELNRMSVSHIVSDKKLIADCRMNARALTKAANEGDFKTAFEHSKALRFNLEVLRLKGDAKKVVADAESLLKKGRHAKKGTIYGDHQDALIDLSVRFGFTRTLPKTPLQHTVASVVAEFNAEAMENDDLPLDVPEWMLTGSMDYRKMQFGQFQELANLAEFLYGEGKELVSAREETFRNTVKQAVEGTVNELKDQKHKYTANPNSIVHGWRSMVNWGTKLRNIVGMAVDWNQDATLQKLYDEMAYAESEQTQIMADPMRQCTEALDALYKATRGLDFTSISDIPFPQGVRARNYKKWDAEKLVAACLNMGTAKNKQRLIDGYEWAENGEDYVNRLASMLTAEDWANIQKIWDAIGTLTSRTSQTFKEEYHYDLKLEDAVPFTVKTKDGQEIEVAGGYYPLEYLYHKNSVVNDRAEALKNAPRFRRASFTFTRNEGVTDPVSLSLNLVFSHIFDASHYISHRGVMRKVLRVINDSAFRDHFQQTQGFERYAALKALVENVAAPGAALKGMTSGLENWGRAMVTASALWASPSVVAMQLSSITYGLDELGGYYLEAAAENMAHPVDTFKFVMGHSGMMRDRVNLKDLDLKMRTNRFSQNTAVQIRETVKQFGYSPMRFVDLAVAIPAWKAAYDRALDAGKSDSQAVAAADEFVAKTQGATRAIDLSPLQLKAWGRGLTVFFSAVSAGSTMATRTVSRIYGGHLSPLEAAYSATMNIILPLFLSCLIRFAVSGAGAGDDPDKARRAFLRELITNPFQGVPVVRDVADFAAARILNKGKAQRTVIENTSLRSLSDLAVTAFDGIDAAFEDNPDRACYKLADAVGTLLEVPVVRVYERLRQMLVDWTGDEDIMPDIDEETKQKKSTKKRRRRR